MSLQEALNVAHDLLGQSKLLTQNSLDLFKHDLPYDKFVFGKNQPNDVRAESTGGKGAHQDVGVEEDSHDTDLNISSSVR